MQGAGTAQPHDTAQHCSEQKRGRNAPHSLTKHSWLLPGQASHAQQVLNTTTHMPLISGDLLQS